MRNIVPSACFISSRSFGIPASSRVRSYGGVKRSHSGFNSLRISITLIDMTRSPDADRTKKKLKDPAGKKNRPFCGK